MEIDTRLVAYYPCKDGTLVKGGTVLLNTAVGAPSDLGYSGQAMDGHPQPGCSWLLKGGRWGKPTLYLNGAGGYVDCGNNSRLSFERDDQFTLEAWISTSASAVMPIVAKVDAVNGRGYRLYLDANGYLCGEVSNQLPDNVLRRVGTEALDDGEWHHVMMTYDGSSNVDGLLTYLDGQPHGAAASNNLAATVVHQQPLRIGSDGSSDYFKGQIDEVAIHNRALSASEVLGHYEMGRP